MRRTTKLMTTALLALSIAPALQAQGYRQDDRRQDPRRYSYPEAYEFVTDVPAFDLLCGSARVRVAMEQGAEFEDVAALLDGAEAAFLERRRPHLLYP